jgi:hypothetical protein
VTLCVFPPSFHATTGLLIQLGPICLLPDFVQFIVDISKLKTKTKLSGMSPRENYTDRPSLVGEVSTNFSG